MPNAYTPAVFDPESGFLGQPSPNDWLDVADRPWEIIYSGGDIEHSTKLIVEQTQPIVLNLAEPYGEVWISNQGVGAISLTSSFPLGGMTVIPEGETVVVAADGTSWRSLQPYGSSTRVLLPGQNTTLPDGTSSPQSVAATAWGVGALGLYQPKNSISTGKPKRRGVSFPPQVDPETGGLKTSIDLDLIRDHIFSAILTYKGERPMRPRYGVAHHAFESRPTFEPIYEDVRSAIDAATGEFLSHLSVQGQFSPPGTLYVGIDWASDGIPGAPLRFELAF